MTPTDKQKFDQAVALAQTGRNQEAYNILGQLAPSNPDDSNILLWMAFTSSDPAKARLMLGKVAMLDPENPALASARDWLAAQEKKAAPVATVATPATPTRPEPVRASAPAASANPEIIAKPSPTKSTSAKVKTRSQTRNARALRLGLMIGGGLIVVSFIYFALLLTGIIGVINTDTFSVPAYTGGTRLDLSKTDQDGVIGNLNLKSSTFANRVSFDAYIIKNADKTKALDFFDSELKKQSWLASPRFTTPTLSRAAYLKASRTVVIGITSGNNVPPNILSRLKPDESLLSVIATQIETITPTASK